jgi:NADPH-dependent stearoyl-CoA 9-desaturase
MKDASHRGGGPPDEARLRAFGEAIDVIRARVEKKIGAEDVGYIRRVRAVSRAAEVAGRLLIHVSLDPITFATGVAALWLHKQLEAAEIGHATLHGAYDRLDGAEAFRSKTFAWDTPIDEASWRYGHNVRHHQYSNVAGRDPDIHFGGLRLNELTPEVGSRTQLPLAMLFSIPNFTFTMNAHFTGLIDVYLGNGRPERFDFLPDRSLESILVAHRRAFRKYVPYYFKNFVFYPLLAGPFFGKVLLGNWLAEVLCDLYMAASIYCGHVGDEVATFPKGTRAGGRGKWYAMQVESSQNFEVSWPLSVLCGALDKQIEHHLFPKLPANRLREVAGEVRAACEEHGVRYHSDSWPRTLRKVVRRVVALNRPATHGRRPRAALTQAAAP